MAPRVLRVLTDGFPYVSPSMSLVVMLVCVACGGLFELLRCACGMCVTLVLLRLIVMFNVARS